MTKTDQGDMIEIEMQRESDDGGHVGERGMKERSEKVGKKIVVSHWRAVRMSEEDVDGLDGSGVGEK